MGDSDDVYLVDDGSTDGTAESVVGLKDERINVIRGDGRLYWAKAMRKAWDVAVTRKHDWDGYLWLNDDTFLNDGAVQRLFAANDGQRIVVGDLANGKGEIVYGLRDGGMFTGNCVFVPRKVYERLGMICGEYSHAWADSDYAILARKIGVRVVSAGVVGYAEGHPNRPRLTGLSLRERIKQLTDPKGWNLHDLWLYRRRNWGYCAAIASCAHMVVHILIGER